MARLRISEALKAYSDRTGERMTQNDLAAKIYPDASPQSRAINLSRLSTGKAKTVNLETIKIICNLTGVSPNFLFGYPFKN